MILEYINLMMVKEILRLGTGIMKEISGVGIQMDHSGSLELMVMGIIKDQ
jgi:hypothetical protein